jgi:transposase-like protein
MKPKSALQDVTLVQLIDRFANDDTARQHLESIRWEKGIVCPKCGCKEQRQFSAIAANPAKKVRAGLRYCASCKSQFTVTIGTIFEDSHIPLRKWLIAWYLICSSKKGVSSLYLQRALELGSYRSALFMAHRIRYALKDSIFTDKLSGTVEADEGFIGGTPDKTNKSTEPLKGYRVNSNKIAVMAMMERGGRVRSQVVPSISGGNLKKAIEENVAVFSEVHTDAWKGYRNLGPKYFHFSVKHQANEFTRHEAERTVTVNSVESYFSLLKRGVIGTFHHISPKYLPLYLAEFDHRHNFRKQTDGTRTDSGLRKVEGKRLMYRTA